MITSEFDKGRLRELPAVLLVKGGVCSFDLMFFEGWYFIRVTDGVKVLADELGVDEKSIGSSLGSGIAVCDHAGRPAEVSLHEGSFESRNAMWVALQKLEGAFPGWGAADLTFIICQTVVDGIPSKTDDVIEAEKDGIRDKYRLHNCYFDVDVYSEVAGSPR